MDEGTIYSVIREILPWKQHTYGLLNCLDEKELVSWPKRFDSLGLHIYDSSVNSTTQDC